MTKSYDEIKVFFDSGWDAIIYVFVDKQNNIIKIINEKDMPYDFKYIYKIKEELYRYNDIQATRVL